MAADKPILPITGRKIIGVSLGDEIRLERTAIEAPSDDLFDATFVKIDARAKDRHGLRIMAAARRDVTSGFSLGAVSSYPCHMSRRRQRHQKKSGSVKKRKKVHRPRDASDGELQNIDGAMTGLVRGFRRVAGAESAENRSRVGMGLLVALGAVLLIALAVGLSQ